MSTKLCMYVIDKNAPSTYCLLEYKRSVFPSSSSCTYVSDSSSSSFQHTCHTHIAAPTTNERTHSSFLPSFLPFPRPNKRQCARLPPCKQCRPPPPPAPTSVSDDGGREARENSLSFFAGAHSGRKGGRGSPFSPLVGRRAEGWGPQKGERGRRGS